MIDPEKYENTQNSQYPSELRWLRALEATIRREAHNDQGWAKNAWMRKMVGKMILTSQLEQAEQSVLQPLDFEPRDGVMTDDILDEEGEGGIAT